MLHDYLRRTWHIKVGTSYKHRAHIHRPPAGAAEELLRAAAVQHKGWSQQRRKKNKLKHLREHSRGLCKIRLAVKRGQKFPGPEESCLGFTEAENKKKTDRASDEHRGVQVNIQRLKKRR